MTHLKQQKDNLSLRDGGYNNNCVSYPRSWADEIIFAVLDVSLTTGLSRSYKTEGLLYLYFAVFVYIFMLFLLDTLV